MNHHGYTSRGSRTLDFLLRSIRRSARQFVVFHMENIARPRSRQCGTAIISGRRLLHPCPGTGRLALRRYTSGHCHGDDPCKRNRTDGSRNETMARLLAILPRNAPGRSSAGGPYLPRKRDSIMKRWLELLLFLAGLVSSLATRARADDPPGRSGHCWSWAVAVTTMRHQKDILTRGISRRAAVEWAVAYDPNTSHRAQEPRLRLTRTGRRGFDVIVHDECSSSVNDKASIDTILKPHRTGSRRRPPLRHALLPHRRLEPKNRHAVDAIHGPDLDRAWSAAADRRHAMSTGKARSRSPWPTGRPSMKSSITMRPASSSRRPMHLRAASRGVSRRS